MSSMLADGLGTTDGPPTIAAIAAAAGVSAPTVSKVLNGRPDVAPATRARVEEVLRELRYRRRPRAAATQQAPLLELVFNELNAAWSFEIISGVESVASRRGVGVVLSQLGGSHRTSPDWLEAVLNRRSQGVVLVLSDLGADQREQLAARSIPCVVLDAIGELPAGVPAVGSNNWNGGLSATRHLLGLGHRRVGMISGPADVLCSRARIDGFRSAHAELGLTVDPDLVRFGNFDQAGGYRHGRSLLDRPDRPTAIFAGSDMQALGVMRAAHELGLDVPGDLSVIGYDDVPLAAWTLPALTTVRQPLRAMAEAATRIVLDLAAGHTPPLQRLDLPTELVIRESTAAYTPRE